MDILLTTITVVLFLIIIVIGLGGVIYLIIASKNDIRNKKPYFKYLAKTILKGDQCDACEHDVRPLTKEAKVAMKTKKHK